MMLTSSMKPEDMDRCRGLGIGACLVKPIRQSELLQAVVNLSAPAVAAVPKAVPTRAPGVSSPHLEILLAEDNAMNQLLAVRVLERAGHAVAVVNTGLEALSALSSKRFDLILMDVHMPEMNGLDATRAIRAKENEAGDHVPIIAMTAAAMSGDREQCLAAGLDGYISKPISISKLVDLIAEKVTPAAAVEQRG